MNKTIQWKIKNENLILKFTYQLNFLYYVMIISTQGKENPSFYLGNKWRMINYQFEFIYKYLICIIYA